LILRYNKELIIIVIGENIVAISKVSKGFGKFQKGEDVIVCTYPNADKAVESILKRT